MKNLRAMFKGKAFAPVVALSATMFGTAAAAQLSHSINFNDHALNCATLQGSRDPIPNGLTCGFVEEVERYFKGPKLQCDPAEPGDSQKALQAASRHLAVSHGQPGMFKYTETTIARILAANDENTTTLQQLRNTHPGEEENYYLTYLVIEGAMNRVKNGLSIENAIAETARLFDERGYKLPETSGSTQDGITELFSKNPVITAHLQCAAEYPQPTWAHYER